MHACDDVSFSVAAGSTLGIIGESGSGKTTLGRCVLRLIEPSSGAIVFDGVDIMRLSRPDVRKLRACIQIVFQEPVESFNPKLRVGTQLELPLRIHFDLGAAERAERVRALLERVGLPAHVASAMPNALPAGVLQRCSIARALAAEPRLLVLDEPTSSLAPEAEVETMALLKRLQRELGLAYLFISHDLSLVRSFCDDVAVMYLGQIVELAPRGDLRPAGSSLHPGVARIRPEAGSGPA